MAKDTMLSFAQSPESLGISSRAILKYLDSVEKSGSCMHGFLVMRYGRIAAEGYWPPFSGEKVHRMYSISKSFTSLAIGLLYGEGKISLDDPVVSYFPDKLPENVHPYVARCTIRDCLMMATHMSENSYGKNDKDWAWTFFNYPPSHPSGTIFSYNTAATVVLCAIVERVSGKPFIEYLRPRLLDPIGASPEMWCVKTPEGPAWGGSGVMATLRDLTKVAMVCMDKGRWQGKQLISEEYITAATSKQIDNSVSTYEHGYGYQIWMERDGGFHFWGMGSQHAFCLPNKEFIFTCTADTQSLTSTVVIDAMWSELYETLTDSPLPEDPEALSDLRKRCANLKFLPPAGEVSSPAAGKVSGITYRMNKNPMDITKMRFTFAGDEGVWEYTNAQGENTLKFGIGKYASGLFPQKNYFGPQIGVTPGIQYPCEAGAAWALPETLNMLIYATGDYLGTIRATFVFKEDEVSVMMLKAAEWFFEEYQGFAGGSAEK